MQDCRTSNHDDPDHVQIRAIGKGNVPEKLTTDSTCEIKKDVKEPATSDKTAFCICMGNKDLEPFPFVMIAAQTKKLAVCVCVIVCGVACLSSVASNVLTWTQRQGEVSHAGLLFDR